MNTASTTTKAVNDYRTGALLGTIEMSDERLAKYEANAQRDTGTIRADDVLFFLRLHRQLARVL